MLNTFRAVHFRYGCDGEVAINNIQEEVGWVVVGLAGISWNTERNDPCLIFSVLYFFLFDIQLLYLSSGETLKYLGRFKDL